MSKTFGGPQYSSYAVMANDKKYVDRFQAPEAGRAIAVEVYCGAGTSAAKFKGLVYSDSGSEAANLLGTGAEVSLGAGSSPVWRRSTLATPFNFASGQWLHFGPFTPTNGFRLYRGGSGAGHSSYADDTYPSPEATFGTHDSYTWRLSVRLVYELLNLAPNAPTLLSPIDSATVQVSQAQTFQWTFSDDDAGDAQSAFQLRYRKTGDAAWTTIPAVTSPNSQTVISGSTFEDGESYEWQVMTADRANAWGPWSSSGYFSGVLTGDLPIISDPADQATITTSAYTLLYTASLQDGFRARRVNDVAGSPGSTVYFDTGLVSDSGAREYYFGLDTSGRWEHWQVQTLYEGNWSSWASVRVYVDFLPPALPTVTVDVSTGFNLRVSASHPAPTGRQPTVTMMDVWRRLVGPEWIMLNADPKDLAGQRIAKDLAPVTTFTDWAVRRGGNYEYAVVARSAGGAQIMTEYVG
jgi:hypothetical protein